MTITRWPTSNILHSFKGDGIVTANEASGTTIRCTKSATAKTGPPHYIHQVQRGGGSGNVQISGMYA